MQACQVTPREPLELDAELDQWLIVRHYLDRIVGFVCLLNPVAAVVDAPGSHVSARPFELMGTHFEFLPVLVVHTFRDFVHAVGQRLYLKSLQHRIEELSLTAQVLHWCLKVNGSIRAKLLYCDYIVLLDGDAGRFFLMIRLHSLLMFNCVYTVVHTCPSVLSNNLLIILHRKIL